MKPRTVLATVVALAVLPLVGCGRDGAANHASGSSQDLKALMQCVSRSLAQYQNDFDGQFPPATFNLAQLPVTNWQGVNDRTGGPARPLLPSGSLLGADLVAKAGLEYNPAVAGQQAYPAVDRLPVVRSAVNDAHRGWVLSDGTATVCAENSPEDTEYMAAWGKGGHSTSTASATDSLKLPTDHVLPNFAGLHAVKRCTFDYKPNLKTVTFSHPVVARYFALEALTEINHQEFTSIAELSFLGDGGKRITAPGAKVIFADSEETKAENGSAQNILDGNPNTIWHTAYSGGVVPLPHVVVVDLGQVYNLTGFEYLPRQNGPNGHIWDCRIYAQEQPFILPTATPGP